MTLFDGPTAPKKAGAKGERKPSAPRVSPTKLNTYLACPRQYFYAYIRRLPRRARSYFSFGTSLHSTLQDFHQAGGTATQEVGQLLEGLQTSWVDAGYATPEEASARFDLGQQVLTAYYEAEEQRESETLFLEKMLSVPQEGFILTGRVDRVDRRPDGLLEVLDYKSGSYLPTAQELEEDLAIAIYQLLVSRTLGTTPVIGTIYNLRSNEAVSLLRDQAALEDVEQQVKEVFTTLNGDTDWEPNPNSQCRYCDFASYCPAAE